MSCVKISHMVKNGLVFCHDQGAITFWCWSQYKLLEVWSLPTYKGTPPWELTSIFHDFLECTPCRHLHVVIPLHHNRHYNELIRLILTKYALSYVCDVPFGNGRRIQCLRITLLFQPSTCWGYYRIMLAVIVALMAMSCVNVSHVVKNRFVFCHNPGAITVWCWSRRPIDVIDNAPLTIPCAPILCYCVKVHKIHNSQRFLTWGMLPWPL